MRIRDVIVQKMRQARGQNYMLCHQGADEIMRLRKVMARLEERIQVLDE